MTQRNSGPVVRGLERSSEGRAAGWIFSSLLPISCAPPFLRLPANHTQPCQPGALQMLAASLCCTMPSHGNLRWNPDIQCLGITPKEQMEPGPLGSEADDFFKALKKVGCGVDILWMFYVFPTLEYLKLKLANWTTFRIFSPSFFIETKGQIWLLYLKRLPSPGVFHSI